jgi:hypothetical protein
MKVLPTLPSVALLCGGATMAFAPTLELHVGGILMVMAALCILALTYRAPAE